MNQYRAELKSNKASRPQTSVPDIMAYQVKPFSSIIASKWLATKDGSYNTHILVSRVSEGVEMVHNIE